MKSWKEHQAEHDIYLTKTAIHAIQADALEHATRLLTAHADSQQAGFEAVFAEMLRVRKLIGTPNVKGER
jgi:hypothetical protein